MSTLADDLQAIALHEIVTDTNGARLRQLYRWYSKAFSTPLHLVPALPLTEILCAFWEERYTHMDEDELEEERVRLLESPEERAAKQREKDLDAASTDALARKLEAELLNAAVRPPSKSQKIEDVKPPAPIKTRQRVPETTLPERKEPTTPLPESVSVRFAATDFFDELADRIDSVVPSEGPNLPGKPPRK